MGQRTVVAAALLAALLIMALATGPVAPARAAAALDQRIQAVAKAIDEADLMYASAKKGHLPSVQVVNELYARLKLARDLYDRAREATEAGRKYDAGAHLDAAKFLAQQVYDASNH